MRSLLICLLLPACMPDLDALSEGVPSLACEWSPNEGATTTVPEGECWRVVALSPDARVRLEDETCEDARECLTALAGETVVPLTRLGADVTDADFETVTWPCDEIESACSEAP